MLPIVTPELAALRKIFNADGFDLRLVGGCVRDWMRGETPKDIDLCTDATPDEQIAIYNRHGVAFYPTGVDHGTVSAMVGSVLYEITSLRTEDAHDGRHAVVCFTRDWEGDLERRDLTINAMAMSFEGHIYDPFRGLTDLTQGVVRFVGDPERRIAEDYLRILRFFRFHGRYSTQPIHAASGAAIAHGAKGLHGISRERVREEMFKILAHDSAPDILYWMHLLGVLEHINLGGNDSYDAFNAAHKHTRNPVTLLVTFQGQEAGGRIGRMWKMSKDEIQFAEWLAKRVEIFPTLTAMQWQVAIQKVPKTWVQEWARVWGGVVLAAAIEAWEVPILPITGEDLKTLGYAEGKELGSALSAMRMAWAVGGYRATRDELLEAACKTPVEV